MLGRRGVSEVFEIDLRDEHGLNVVNVRTIEGAATQDTHGSVKGNADATLRCARRPDGGSAFRERSSQDGLAMATKRDTSSVVPPAAETPRRGGDLPGDPAGAPGGSSAATMRRGADPGHSEASPS